MYASNNAGSVNAIGRQDRRAIRERKLLHENFRSGAGALIDVLMIFLLKYDIPNLSYG